MQKFNDPCIKTGDFARLCGTNKRTLIHYDEIGLFKPAYTDDRGYRYYSESQFDVFFTINCLSKLGMPLKEIGAFLNHRNPCSHIGYCNKNNLNAGHPYGAMLDVSELRQGHLDTYAYFFTKVIDRPEDFPFHIKPAGTYAVAYLKGDYYDSEETYRKLFQWIDENGFRTGQYSYKEAIIDELAADSSEEYLTKISVQIF